MARSIALAGMMLGILSAGLPPTAAAQGTDAAAKPNVTFDHKTDKVKIFDLELENGQTFIVDITNTCPDEFDYPYVGVARGMAPQAGTKKPLSIHRITVTFDDQYGGYAFAIARKADVAPGSICEGGEALQPGSFIVSVREQEWGVSFSGGFTFSGLTSPVFGITTENNVKKVVEEPDKQDSLRLGAASFVHVFHDSVRWKGLQPAVAFGLGINSDNKSEYFAGFGLRLGDKATVNVGLAAGSVARLPNGITAGAPVTDDNVLNNMGSRVVPTWFVALSYAFIDTKDRLKKPFATEAAAGGAATQKPATPPAANPNQKIIETVAAAADTYSSIPEMKSVTICRAEAKIDGENVAVTLHVKDPSTLPKPPDALIKSATESLQKRIQASIKDKPPTVKPPVVFGSTCS